MRRSAPSGCAHRFANEIPRDADSPEIKGSTELEQDLDPEQARAIIDPGAENSDRCGTPLRWYVQNTGDGIFALFGAPAAHEDHPQRAIHAALRMQQEIRRYGDQLLQGGEVAIEIRVTQA